MFEKLTFEPGLIIYNDFNINKELSLKEQINLLKEDLFQVQYDGGELIIDVGWYPEFSEEGQFIVLVIKGYNWHEPILKENCKSFEVLECIVQKSIDVVNKLRD